MPPPKTLFDKVWDRHVVVAETADTPGVLYIDLHLVHEVTSPQAFTEIEARGLQVRRPDRTFATLDHSTPTLPAGLNGLKPYVTAEAEAQVHRLESNCARHGIPLAGWDSDDRGVVHVMGPELGLTQPGMTVVCGDSHTATHGAFGALAFGIGTSEVSHVLATQCLIQRKSKAMRVTIDGTLAPGVSGKDVALAVIAELGFGGGTGFVIEYAGEAVRGLDMEGRMTLCNMSIEAGARAGMIAPDQKTVAWLKGRRHVATGAAFEAQAAEWLTLASDPGAVFDAEVALDGSAIRPMATWGTTPDAGSPIGSKVPEPKSDSDRKALAYMGFEAGQTTTTQPVDVVFIGSCTNGRLPDLRAAADVLRGRKVKAGVRMLVVPGSEAVRRDAEAEGLHTVFTEAGAEWRIPGCSMCIAMNGDVVGAGQLAVSTSNRNFEGRQGKGARTILASPATAAASAIAGVLTDPRVYLEMAMPEPLKVLTSRTLVLTQANIDTDQIIPARFLTTTESKGLGAKAFYDWRYETDGSARPEAVLNRIDPSEHRILVAGDNFGCGSSREHAPWALYDYGFRAVISTSIADIFTSNALKNGFLPVVVDQATWDDLVANPEQVVTVDLEAGEVRRGNHAPVAFSVEPFARQCLLDGVDTLGWLQNHMPAIETYERQRAPEPA